MAKTTRRDAPWLKYTDVDQMLQELAPRGDERRMCLFACACCRLAWPLLGERARQTVEVFERYAAGEATRGEVFAQPYGVPWSQRPAALWAAEAVSALRSWFVEGE